MFELEKKRQMGVLKYYFYNDTPRKSCRHNSSYNVEANDSKSTRLSDTIFFVDSHVKICLRLEIRVNVVSFIVNALSQIFAMSFRF